MGGVRISITAAASVLISATAATAARKTRWVPVPQMPSGFCGWQRAGLAGRCAAGTLAAAGYQPEPNTTAATAPAAIAIRQRSGVCAVTSTERQTVYAHFPSREVLLDAVAGV